MNIVEALEDPLLLAPALVGDKASWWSWAVFLRSFFGLPMNSDEADFYRECSGRTE